MSKESQQLLTPERKLEAVIEPVLSDALQVTKCWMLAAACNQSNVLKLSISAYSMVSPALL